MKCANPKCNAEGLYLRSGSLHALDFMVAGGQESDRQTISRKIVWLCARCTGQFEIETWRPPGQQLRPRNSESAPLAKSPVARFEKRLAAQRVAS
jgi:hypothetical protein